MKIPALLTFLLAALLAMVPLHHARADEVSFDVFYNSLADDGDWYNTPEYGYVWQPYIAYKTEKWRPYSDGYWAQTDDGWTWVSYENFGWATYHYGRWTRLKDLGWAWVPGYDWGPGWVSWRTNDDYVGWAPLPPKSEEGVYEGRAVETRREQIDYSDVEPEDAGYGTNVDVQYDIGPANYCFVETRSFGAPVLGEVILPPERNVVFIERTTNVTNIYYRRQGPRTVVYNNGPDFFFINNHVERPIPRLRIERHDDAGFLSNGLRGGGNPTLVRDGVLNVATPMIARRPVAFAQVKPTRIKQTITQPQVVRGWSNSGADQAVAQRIRQQYKQQAAAAPARPANPVIPPPAQEREHPDRAAGNTPPAGGGAQPFEARQPGKANPPATGAPHGPLTEEERLARRDARQKEREQRTGGQPAAAPGAPAAAATPTGDPERDARRAARQAGRGNGQQPGQAETPAPAAQGAVTDQEREARRAARQSGRANGQPAAPATAPSENAQPGNDQDRDARRAARQAARANGQQTPAPGANQGQPEGERPNRQAPRQPEQARQPSAPQADNAQADQERDARRAARQQERANQPAQQAAQPEAQPDQEARRAARQQERAPQQAQGQQQQPDQEARRAARQQERAGQAQAQQAQQQQAQQQQAQQQQEQEARRAARQQERAAQPAQQTQPQGQNKGDGSRGNKPGQSPNP